MKMTRRALAGLAALSAVPLPQSIAQKSTAQTPSAPAGRQDAAAAHRQFQDAAREMAAVKLARAVEPAVRFEA